MEPYLGRQGEPGPRRGYRPSFTINTTLADSALWTDDERLPIGTLTDILSRRYLPAWPPILESRSVTETGPPPKIESGNGQRKSNRTTCRS